MTGMQAAIAASCPVVQRQERADSSEADRKDKLSNAATSVILAFSQAVFGAAGLQRCAFSRT